MFRTATLCLLALAPVALAEAPSGHLDYSAKTKSQLTSAHKLFHQGHYQKALDAYQDAIESGATNSPNAHVGRAFCQLRLGQLPRAVALFTRALDRFPPETSCRRCARRAHAGRAEANFALGEHLAASADQSKVVQLLNFQIGSLEDSQEPVPESLRQELADARFLLTRYERKVRLVHETRKKDTPRGSLAVDNRSNETAVILINGTKQTLKPGESYTWKDLGVGACQYALHYPALGVTDRKQTRINENELLTVTIR